MVAFYLGTDEVTLTEPIRGWKHLAVGDTLKGTWHNVRHKVLLFDGCKPHMVEDFTGVRLSLVAFANSLWTGTPLTLRDTLVELGFNLPRRFL